MKHIDIIIPLGPGTCSHNDELRLFLRSLQKNGLGAGTVWLVTACPPEWLAPGNGLRVLHMADRFAHNKDANLFEKVRLGMDVSECEDVVWTCDDCAILQPLYLPELPVIYNTRTLADFDDDRKWTVRMRTTLRELGLEGGNFDTHCPQRWNRLAALAAIEATPYEKPAGRCINTSVMGRMLGGIPAGAVEQDAVKETVEEHGDDAKLDRWFVAYNDWGFLNGLRERLFVLFPEKSRWEK